MTHSLEEKLKYVLPDHEPAVIARVLDEVARAVGRSSYAEGALPSLVSGLAKGELRGDDLRHVMERLPYLSMKIERHLGVNSRELLQRGASANEVLGALSEKKAPEGRNG